MGDGESVYWFCRSNERKPSHSVKAWLEFWLMAADRRYLYIEQLARRTPWSANAIRLMMARGAFKLGVHYFKPRGASGRPIFSWEAIVKYIEEGGDGEETGDAITLADGTVIDLDEATKKAHRLRG